MPDHLRTYFSRSGYEEHENHVCQTFAIRLYRSILVSFSILFYLCVSHS